MSDDRVQQFIDEFNADRGRGGDADEEDDEPDRLERLRQSVMKDDEDEG